jgi:L-rhamnose mutarotase
MERHAFAMKVKEGKMNDYRKARSGRSLLHILTVTASIISASGMRQTLYSDITKMQTER